MSKIPRLLMQTWKTRDIPSKWQASVDSVNKHLVPNGWHYILMTDEDNRNFVKEHFPSFLKYYDSFEYPIQRADAIRYMWLYINGGVYMDLDTVVTKDFGPLFDDGASLYLVREANFYKHYATNCFMASAPRHPFWLEVIKAIQKVQDQGLSWSKSYSRAVMILNTTGPNILDDCLRSTIHSYTYLSNKLINPCSTCEPMCHAPDAYVLPLKGRSWTTGLEDAVVENFVCRPCVGASYTILIILGIGLLVILIISLIRYYRS